MTFLDAFLEHFVASDFLPSSQSTMVATIIEFSKYILTLFGVTKKALNAAIENHRKRLLWFCWYLNQMKYKKESVFLLCYIKSTNWQTDILSAFRLCFDWNLCFWSKHLINTIIYLFIYFCSNKCVLPDRAILF